MFSAVGIKIGLETVINGLRNLKFGSFLTSIPRCVVLIGFQFRLYGNTSFAMGRYWCSVEITLYATARFDRKKKVQYTF